MYNITCLGPVHLAACFNILLLDHPDLCRHLKPDPRLDDIYYTLYYLPEEAQNRPILDILAKILNPTPTPVPLSSSGPFSLSALAPSDDAGPTPHV